MFSSKFVSMVSSSFPFDAIYRGYVLTHWAHHVITTWFNGGKLGSPPAQPVPQVLAYSPPRPASHLSFQAAGPAGCGLETCPVQGLSAYPSGQIVLELFDTYPKSLITLDVFGT